MDTYAYDAQLPCKNPHCKSHGKPHPNCKCYSGAGTENYAEGGKVEAFCSRNMPHMSGCEYYAEGGEVKKADPKRTKGHAAVHHGLSGLLTKVGKAKLADKDKHHKTLEEARGHWSRMQDPIDSLYEPPKTLGVRMASHLSQGNHDKLVDELHGHPLVGAMGRQNLAGVIPELGEHIMTKDAHPEALRASMDYMHSAIKGHEALKSSIKGITENGSQEHKSDELRRQGLKNILEEFQKSPEKMLEISGDLSHYMPEHAAVLTAHAATAIEYLNTIKPKPVSLGPLQGTAPPDRFSQANFDRQLDIAENPLLVVQHAKDGTLIPTDMITLQTIYPGLHQSLIEMATDAVVEAQSKEEPIPYKQRQALSMILGEPLDMSQTPEGMQAIIKSQAEQQANNQAKKKSNEPNRATNVALKQINKVDEMAETTLEARQIRKNKD